AAFRAAVEARLRERARRLGAPAYILRRHTRTYKGGGTTRSRDLVDLLLVRQHAHVDATRLLDAIRRVFQSRATHAVPERFPRPPRALAVAYRREAERVAVAAELDEAHQLLADWLDPVLAEIRQEREMGHSPDGTR
ncbi:MAG: nucleotidyl transferase AbiEii/AbiGii toxin family protein, partial [Alphaproteobacteria bacterium]